MSLWSPTLLHLFDDPITVYQGITLQVVDDGGMEILFADFRTELSILSLRTCLPCKVGQIVNCLLYVMVKNQ